MQQKQKYIYALCRESALLLHCRIERCNACLKSSFSVRQWHNQRCVWAIELRSSPVRTHKSGHLGSTPVKVLSTAILRTPIVPSAAQMSLSAGRALSSTVSRPAVDKIICLGKNYLAHAKELGDAVPDKPVNSQTPSIKASIVERSKLPEFVLPWVPISEDHIQDDS